MTDRDILDLAEAAKRDFGRKCGKKCGKYSGAVTVELIRRALEENDLRVSQRDVFILGVPIEIDLLIPKCDARPANRLLYTPADVLAVVEVKNRGSFGDATIRRVKESFRQIREANHHIHCCYLTLAERKGFKWAITERNCDGDVYTMFWHSGSGENETYESTGDWARFVWDMAGIQKMGKVQHDGCTVPSGARGRTPPVP